MRVVRHGTAQAFLERADPWLACAEAEHNLFYGIVGQIRARPEMYPLAPWLLTVESGGVAGAAIMTPPHSLIVARMSLEALDALADWLIRDHAPVPGVLGHVEAADAFARVWQSRTGESGTAGRHQRIYECERVTEEGSAPGALRLAEEHDVLVLLDWAGRFYDDVGETGPRTNLEARVRNGVDDGRFWLWEDGRPACMTALLGDTPRGVRVSWVFTPRELRGRGYATACVAAVTRRAFASGRRFCFLHTDLANPTSNSIYRRIGYRPVCDAREWKFA